MFNPSTKFSKTCEPCIQQSYKDNSKKAKERNKNKLGMNRIKWKEGDK